MSAPPSSLTLLREAMSRATNREGIPMVVALVDERGSIPAVDDPDLRSTGADIVARVRQTRQELAPSMGDADNGGVISALVVAAHELIREGGHRG